MRMQGQAAHACSGGSSTTISAILTLLLRVLVRHRGKRARGGGGAQAGKGRQGLQRNQRTCIIAQYNRDTHAFIRRRARAVDPDAILQLRLPAPPLSLSWGKPVRPFSQQEQQQQPAAVHTAGGPRLRALGLRGLVRQAPALPASRNCNPASAALPPGVSRACRALCCLQYACNRAARL